ncbi:hypothetical protein CYMTET_56678 [Cymbomonas tetramitiformis]|uniref:Uncharacterized protein n=1 Tax=Cymbomonas tetramitiformis TaxID=36881 RepID=A0AAE0ENI7_9CHLO|nr:hypothetical protein CYMTET_56678 [Cymbomonas tetramitiformis]
MGTGNNDDRARWEPNNDIEHAGNRTTEAGRHAGTRELCLAAHEQMPAYGRLGPGAVPGGTLGTGRRVVGDRSCAGVGRRGNWEFAGRYAERELPGGQAGNWELYRAGASGNCELCRAGTGNLELCWAGTR